MNQETGLSLAISLQIEGITCEHIAGELRHRFEYRSGCYDSRLAGYSAQELLEAGMSWPSKSHLFDGDNEVTLFYKFMFFAPSHKVLAVDKALHKQYGASIDSRLRSEIDRMYVELVSEETRLAAEREAERLMYQRAYSDGAIPHFSICKVIRNGAAEYYKSYENLGAYNYALALAQCSPTVFKAAYREKLGLVYISQEQYEQYSAQTENNDHIKDGVIINLDDETMRFGRTPVKHDFECSLSEAAKEARAIFDTPNWQRNHQRFYSVFIQKKFSKKEKTEAPFKIGDSVRTFKSALLEGDGTIVGFAHDDYPDSDDYFIVDFGERGTCTVHKDDMEKL